MPKINVLVLGEEADDQYPLRALIEKSLAVNDLTCKYANRKEPFEKLEKPDVCVVYMKKGDVSCGLVFLKAVFDKLLVARFPDTHLLIVSIDCDPFFQKTSNTVFFQSELDKVRKPITTHKLLEVQKDQVKTVLEAVKNLAKDNKPAHSDPALEAMKAQQAALNLLLGI